MLLFFAAITSIVFALYDLEWEPLCYAFTLCTLSYVVWLGVRFVRYQREAKERWGFLRKSDSDNKIFETSSEILKQPFYKNIPRDDYGNLPVATLAEREYREMLEILGERCRDMATEWQKERQESLDYYSTWVHQIKTPIAVMRMQMQVEDTEENRALLAQLFRIEQYVDMVLSYIRLGSSSNDFVIQEYNLDEIIRQAVHKFAPQFVHSRIRLVYEPTSVCVLTDEKWLLFMIEQLLSNAIKYTANGTVTITVSPQKVLAIADTGIGIAPEDLPRIFEKGFTGYNGRADKKATGLGLYLCKQTADKLGIRMWAQSSPGKGSTFYMDLHRKKMIVE
jgi:signal transduction histidine kinase